MEKKGIKNKVPEAHIIRKSTCKAGARVTTRSGCVPEAGAKHRKHLK